MKDKYEVEYSFICTKPQTLDDLRSEYHCEKTYDIVDGYSDTEDRILSKNKYVLRRRRIEGNTIYTVKGPASGTPPKRLELETEIYHDILTELENRLDIKEPREMEMIQERYTRREEYKFGHFGFSMFIDTTKFDNGARYVNIEIEGDMVEHLNEFKKQLLLRDGIKEWKPSKFQVGEAVKTLDIIGDLRTEDFHKILIYIDNKEKRGKQ